MKPSAHHITLYQLDDPLRAVALVAATTKATDATSWHYELRIVRDESILASPLYDQLNAALQDAWEATTKTGPDDTIVFLLTTAAENVAPHLSSSPVRAVYGTVISVDALARSLSDMEGLVVPVEAWEPAEEDDA